VNLKNLKLKNSKRKLNAYRYYRLVWTGTTSERSPVLPTQTTGTTGTLLKLQNQRSMSYDFRSKFYPTSEDDVDEVNELPFCLFLHQFVDRAPITYERDKDRERT
jgi:cellobiose phosphorylase